MIPFLHFGPISIPTYGLMVATGLMVAAYILQANINRNRTQLMKRGYLNVGDEKTRGDEAFLIIGIAGITGLVGSRIYSALESPRELIEHPAILLSRFGFTWSGAAIPGLIVLGLMARHFRVPVLDFLDLCLPSGALGYGIGRIGCLLSGDGDYGIPTKLPWGMRFPNGLVPTTETCVQQGWPADCHVHPTPIYEFIGAALIAAYLWHVGTKALRGQRISGEIVWNYLILTGIARFLVEFIRLNPKVLWGLTNAQLVSMGSILLGLVLMWRIKSRFRAVDADSRALKTS